MRLSLGIFVYLALAGLSGSAYAEPLSSAPGWSLDKASGSQAEDNTYDESPQSYTLKPPDSRPAISVDYRTAERLRSGELNANSVYSRQAGGSSAKNAAGAGAGGGFVPADPVNSTLTREEGRADLPPPPAEETPADLSRLAGTSPLAGSSGLGSGSSGFAGSGGGLISSSGGSGGGASAAGGGAPGMPPAASPPAASSSSGASQGSPLVDDLAPEGSAAREIGNAHPNTTGKISGTPPSGFAIHSAPISAFTSGSVSPPPPPPPTAAAPTAPAASSATASATASEAATGHRPRHVQLQSLV